MKKPRPQKPLHLLLREIDQAVEEYKRRSYMDFSFVHLEHLLDELEEHHPLKVWTRRHGQRLVDELFGEKNCGFEYNIIESRMRSAFQLPYSGSIIGAVGRDIRRIIESFAEPFIFIGEKIGILYAIIREIRGK